MQFKDFCQNFPTDPQEWPLIQPAKAIPLHWRQTLFARVGGILAASDRSRAKTSSRLGISIRPYQPGDRIATLSLPHLMRTDEMLARVDEAPGQFAARIFVIGTESLQFKSDYANCTKGQVALGMAGLIEAIHLRQNQSVRVIHCTRENLSSQLAFCLHPRLRTASVSVISDFLDNSLEQDLAAMRQANLCAPAIYCVRDPIEEPSDSNPLAELALQLVGAASGGSSDRGTAGGTSNSSASSFFSGQKYLDNLKAENQRYEHAARNAQSKFWSLTESSGVIEMLKAVCESYNLTRFIK